MTYPPSPGATYLVLKRHAVWGVLAVADTICCAQVIDGLQPSMAHELSHGCRLLSPETFAWAGHALCLPAAPSLTHTCRLFTKTCRDRCINFCTPTTSNLPSPQSPETSSHLTNNEISLSDAEIYSFDSDYMLA